MNLKTRLVGCVSALLWTAALGCGPHESASTSTKSGGVNVNAPGVNVNVGSNGVDVKAPGVTVQQKK